jgi:single-stranded DNA-binding protein
VIVEGRVDTRTGQTRIIKNRKSTEVHVEMIHFLEWKAREDGSSGENDLHSRRRDGKPQSHQ